MLERRLLPGDVTALVSTRMEADGFLVAFTERTAGVSEGPFRSLNLGLRSGDDLRLVDENRARVRRALGVEPFTCGHQVHGARVTRIESSDGGRGATDWNANLSATDALLTHSPSLPLAVITADCVPIALTHRGSGAVVVVHAGWRGIAAGIVQEALRAIATPGPIRAAIGPAIAADHYEVGQDVAAAVAKGSGGQAAFDESGPRVRLDLPLTVHGILRRAGIRSVERAEVCTACEPIRFFSHRRDGPCGRQALVAARLA